jgi:hypothetical protein
MPVLRDIPRCQSCEDGENIVPANARVRGTMPNRHTSRIEPYMADLCDEHIDMLVSFDGLEVNYTTRFPDADEAWYERNDPEESR